MARVDWSTKRFFKAREMVCSHCRIERMDDDFVTRLDDLRGVVGFPMVITSGYRCAAHPVEIVKASPGTGVHSLGVGADIYAYGIRAVDLLGAGIKLGFRGFGIQQKGSFRYIHLDTFQGDADQPRPSIWSY